MIFLFWALLSAVLVQPDIVATEPSLQMEPRLWQHELKTTYCQMIQRQRIYKLEQLDVYCAGKVGFFDDEMVNSSAKNCWCSFNAKSFSRFTLFLLV